jgi:hypothetical protein
MSPRQKDDGVRLAKTEYSVKLPEDEREAIRILRAGSTVETWRYGESLDEILASTERLLRAEWLDGVSVFIQRTDDEYLFYVGREKW